MSKNLSPVGRKRGTQDKRCTVELSQRLIITNDIHINKHIVSEKRWVKEKHPVHDEKPPAAYAYCNITEEGFRVTWYATLITPHMHKQTVCKEESVKTLPPEKAQVMLKVFFHDIYNLHTILHNTHYTYTYTILQFLMLACCTLNFTKFMCVCVWLCVCMNFSGPNLLLQHVALPVQSTFQINGAYVILYKETLSHEGTCQKIMVSSFKCANLLLLLLRSLIIKPA